MTMIYSNPKMKDVAGAVPDVEVWQHHHMVRDLQSPIPYAERERVCNGSTAPSKPCPGAGWYWSLPDGKANGPFDAEQEAVEDAQSSKAAERQCIGCPCHRVTWNEGTDYCAECQTDSETQRVPHRARGAGVHQGEEHLNTGMGAHACARKRETTMSQSATKTEKQEAIERLREWLKPGDTVYTILRQVSRSGMQRRISFVQVTTTLTGSNVRHLDYNVSDALSYVRGGDEGVKVRGVGQDMGYHVVYSLGRVLFPQGISAKCVKCAAYPMHREDDGKLMPNRDQHGDLYAYGPCPGWDRNTEPEGEFYGHEFYGRNGDRGPWENDGGYALNHRWL